MIRKTWDGLEYIWIGDGFIPGDLEWFQNKGNEEFRIVIWYLIMALVVITSPLVFFNTLLEILGLGAMVAVTIIICLWYIRSVDEDSPDKIGISREGVGFCYRNDQYDLFVRWKDISNIIMEPRLMDDQLVLERNDGTKVRVTSVDLDHVDSIERAYERWSRENV